MARGVHGTGRTQRIREFLSHNSNEAFTAREIAMALEPEGSVDVFSATLASMASTGKIARLGAARGRVHYFWPRGMATLDRRRKDQADAPAAPRRHVPPPVIRPPLPRTRKRAATVIAEAAAKVATPAATAPKPAPAVRRAASNFVAPVGTPDPALNAKRIASARISDEIAEFQRRGGQIERLGVTKLFHHPDDCEE